MNKEIKNSFEILKPSQNQKERMLRNIKKQISKKDYHYLRFAKVVALIVLCITSLGVVVNAATGGELYEGFKRVVFGGDNKFYYKSEGDHIITIKKEQEYPWIVEEKGKKLILNIVDREIDITDNLKKEGFYYGEFDIDGTKHLVVIARNAGGKKDYAEKWYSQFVWLPEYNQGGNSRGISGPMATALMQAIGDGEESIETIEENIKNQLEKYWEDYK